MSSSKAVSPALSQLDNLKNAIPKKPKGKAKGLAKGHNKAIDRVNVNLKSVSKSLTILAEEVVRKLNELLITKLPEGIESLKPEEHTAEATANRIVSGSTAFLPVFAKQNPELQGEDLIAAFMDTIRGGIKQGYNQAVGILGDIGAFEIDGVESGIQETMRLVEEKLVAFETAYRRDNGIGQEAPTREKPVENTSENNEQLVAIID